MSNEIVPIGKMPVVKSTLSIVQGLVRKVKSCLYSPPPKQSFPRQGSRQDGEIIDVDGVEVANTTQKIIQSLKERRFFDAIDMLRGPDVDMDDRELLYLRGINASVLSKFGMHDDDPRRLIYRSAEKGFAPAQIDMCIWSTDTSNGGMINSSYERDLYMRVEPWEWLTMAAETSGGAAYALARAYHTGFIKAEGCLVGVRLGERREVWVNLLKARKWYEKADALGHTEAKIKLRSLMSKYNASRSGCLEWED